MRNNYPHLVVAKVVSMAFCSIKNDINFFYIISCMALKAPDKIPIIIVKWLSILSQLW